MKQRMTSKMFPFVGMFIIAVTFSACATIITGSRQEVSFISNPDGATVTVNGRVLGKTPMTVSLKKESGQAMIFEKEGYKPLSMQLETHLNPWFWGNLVTGGLIGSTVDGLSGAVHEYSPRQYMVTLQPAGTGNMETQTTLSEHQKIKEYIVANYEQIVNDLTQSTGEHLSSLFSLLEVQADQSADAIKRIRALASAYPDIPQFADHVIEIYVK